MFMNLIAKKKELIEDGYAVYQTLLAKVMEWRYKKINLGSVIGPTPEDFFAFLYNEPTFEEFMTYAFGIKKVCKKINSIRIIPYIFCLIIAGILYFILGSLWAIIVGFVLTLGLSLYFAKLNIGETYEEFYDRTFRKLIKDPYEELKYDGSSEYTNDQLKLLINKDFTSSKLDNNFKARYTRVWAKYDQYGNEIERHETNHTFKAANIVLNEETRSTDKEGKTTTKDTKLFEGLYMSINNDAYANKLKGNKIMIRADDSILSHLFENTRKSVFESQLEYNFNAESLNKAMDCHLSSSYGFVDKADAMTTVTRIISPIVEERLVYLMERYNAFSMDIDDTGISMWVNLLDSLSSKLSGKNLTKSFYKKEYSICRPPHSKSSGNNDFLYCNCFPYVEKIYTMKILNSIYHAYVKEDYYKKDSDLLQMAYLKDIEVIERHEEQMRDIMASNASSFRRKYIDVVNRAYNNSKENL